MKGSGDNKSNRKKRRSGDDFPEDQQLEDSRVSGGRSGGRQRRGRDNKSRGSRISNGGMDFDDQETQQKKRREDHTKQIDKQKQQVIKDMKHSQQNMSM